MDPGILKCCHTKPDSHLDSSVHKWFLLQKLPKVRRGEEGKEEGYESKVESELPNSYKICRNVKELVLLTNILPV